MENEHPSLTLQPSTSKTLETAQNEIQTLRARITGLQETAKLIETDLQSLEVVDLIGGLEKNLADVSARLDQLVASLQANAAEEAELLSQAKRALGRV